MLASFRPSLHGAARRFSIGARGVATASTNAYKAATNPTATMYRPRPQDEDARPLDIKFWTGKPIVPYNEVQVDCSKVDMSKVLHQVAEGEWAVNENCKESETLKAEMDAKYEEHGALHLINSHLNSSQFAPLVRLMHPEPPIIYEGGANSRGQVEKNVYDTGAPSRAHILYHNEIAYLHYSPKWVAFGATEGTGVLDRGATFLANGVGATKLMMQTKMGEKLKEKGLCYIRKLPDREFFRDNKLDDSIVYNFWQQSTLSEDMHEAEEIMRRKGLEVEWEDSPVFGRYMVTKFYTSAFEFNPADDRNTLYASIADDFHWFDTWPGLNNLPHWERPLKLNYGDGEVMTREEKQFWVDCYDNNGLPINWNKGDLAIVCNRRWLHGRPGYELKEGEKRELGVVLGETFERQHEVEGKWRD